MSRFCKVVEPDFEFDNDKIHIKKYMLSSSQEVYTILYDFGNKEIKVPLIVGFGKIIEKKLEYIIVDISLTTTANTVKVLRNDFHVKDTSNKIKMSYKHIQNIENFCVGSFITFAFSFDLQLISLDYYKLLFKCMWIKKCKDISFKYLQLYNYHKKKRMVEIIRHPDNIDFEKFIMT